MCFDTTLDLGTFRCCLTTSRWPYPFQTASEFFKDIVVRDVFSDLIPDPRKAGHDGVLCLLTWWQNKTNPPAR